MVKIHTNQTTHSQVSHLIEPNTDNETHISAKEKAMDCLTENNNHLVSKLADGDKQLESKIKPKAKENELPEARLDLVNEVRARLKVEYDNTDDSDERYSKAHYDDIMDQSSPNTCWRYLLQRDLDVDAALELIKATLAWRKQNRIDEIKPNDMVKDFWLRAPIGMTGKTRDGNDLFYAVGRNFRKPDPMVKQLVRDFIGYILFSWDKQHNRDLEQFVVVFDVTNTGYRNIDLDFARWLVSIRDFVPARVKAVYFVGIPFLIRPIIRLIISWLPERFKKIAYCGTYDELVRANIDDECIPEEIGGKSDSRWRLAPIDSKWAHELEEPDAKAMFEEICKACNFNTSQDYLDKIYKMQRNYEKSIL